ncbi:MAG: hypothetical protein IH596_03240, partial [Bacteroidales bacterium]|nr:hypothetical protein [Bacteroidales bacterium]
VFVTLIARAQNLLNKPEHVVFDETNQCYLVTNYGNGKIISIDTSGNQEVIIEGITGCLGIHIIDTTIFISAGQNIHMYGLISHAFIQTLPLIVTNWVDGMTDDGAGNLYAAENAGKVHKVDLSTYTDTIIVNGGLPANPQDLAYDPDGNRLLLVCWGTNSPIVSIDLSTYTVTDLVQTTSGQYDGIVRDENGNLYVTSWMNSGRVYKWEPPYTSDPSIVSQGHAGPAGLAVNESGKILAVPNFNANSISYLSLIPTGIADEKENPEIYMTDKMISIHSLEPFNLSVHDMAGRTIFRKLFPYGETRVSVDQILKNDAPGMFVVTVTTRSLMKSVKIIR